MPITVAAVVGVVGVKVGHLRKYYCNCVVILVVAVVVVVVVVIAGR